MNVAVLPMETDWLAGLLVIETAPFEQFGQSVMLTVERLVYAPFCINP